MTRAAPARVLATLAALAGAPALGAAQDGHVLIVVGIGGEEAYEQRFHEWASGLKDALVARHGLAAGNVTYLGEDPTKDPARIQGPSRVENIKSTLSAMAGKAGPQDRVLIVIFGHGTTRGAESVLNLPGPDLSADSLAVMLADFPTQEIAVVNTASASGAFVQALSGPKRTVITATRTANERNETWFGKYFSEAFSGDQADLDKDGRVSLLEAYAFAKREVARQYQEATLLLTEHSLLDDDGDERGTGEPADSTADGRLAKTFAFGRVGALNPANVTDPVLKGLLEQRAELERRLDALRARRDTMEAAAYDRELEALLVEIALKDREIRLRGGGGGP
jgi:hypothetical protein